MFNSSLQKMDPVEFRYTCSDLTESDSLDDLYYRFTEDAKEGVVAIRDDKLRDELSEKDLIHMVCGTIFWTVIHNQFKSELRVSSIDDLKLIQYLNERQNMLFLFSRKLVSLHPEYKTFTQQAIDCLVDRANTFIFDQLKEDSSKTDQELVFIIPSLKFFFRESYY